MPAACAIADQRARVALDRLARCSTTRRERGFVRQCHGDLHLRNIVLLDGQPTLFDGIEFNDEIACIDVLYDLAFLLMDLWRRRLAAPRECGLERAISPRRTISTAFRCCRCFSRAERRCGPRPARRRPGCRPIRSGGAKLQELAREYLSLAERLLQPPAPCLIGVGGLSGSGKSTLAHGAGAAGGRRARGGRDSKRRDSEAAVRRGSAPSASARRGTQPRCLDACTPP